MPPRRSARAAAAASSMTTLPHALVLHILSLLPVDSRLLCAGVCRSWRAALEDTSLWLRLDLSTSGDSPKREVTDALLHAAVARAHGELVALDISGCKRVTFRALLAAVTANGGTLRELRMCGVRVLVRGAGFLRPLGVEPLLRAAPRLAVFEADVRCTELALARRLLRNEPAVCATARARFRFSSCPRRAGRGGSGGARG
jgi:hypothetical protein